MSYICCLALSLFVLLFTKTIDAQDGPGCLTPESFAFGSVLLNNEEVLDPDGGSQWTDIDSTLKFSCLRAYRMTGPGIVMCKEDGTWDFEFPVCNKRVCDPPPDIANAKKLGLRRVPGSTVRYECYSGYTYRNPEATALECIKFSASIFEWSGELPACIDAVTCPSLPVIPHGFITVSPVERKGVYFPGDEVELFCKPGFEMNLLKGTNLVSCEDNGTWDEQIATCIDPGLTVEVTCKRPELSEFSYLEGDNGLDFYPEASEVRIQCLSGYELDGVARNWCTKDGWEYDFPKCKEITCPRPKLSEFSYLEGGLALDPYPEATEVRIQCQPGYELLGVTLNRCTKDGWEYDFPECKDNGFSVEENTCPRPKLSEFSYLEGDDGLDTYPEDIVVRVQCLPGYELVGVTLNRCTKDGWKYAFPKCKVPDIGSRTLDNKVPEITCPRPDLSAFSYIEGDDGLDYYPEDLEVRIQCLPGYELVGVTLNRCTGDGWEYNFPECKDLSTSEPVQALTSPPTPAPTQALTSPPTPVPTQALTSPSTPEPTQALIECAAPKIFPHGTIEGGDDDNPTPVNESQMFPVDSAIRFYCNNGFALNGAKVVLCGDNGKWESNFPTCYKRRCSDPPDVPHGKWLGLRRTPGNTVRLSCKDGYKLRNPEVSKLECQRASPPDVEWFGEQPACVEKAVCPDPGSPRNATGHRLPEATYGTFYEGSKIWVSCYDGYDLIGSESIVCGIDGNWSGPRGRCKPNVTCPDLPVEPNGFFSVKSVGRSDYYFPADEVELKCNPGYKPYTSDGGALYVLCFKDGTWDEGVATCRPTFCSSPKLLKNSFLEGGTQLLDSYAYNAHLKIRCPQGYQLLGTNWNRCTDQGWDFEFPECNEITCPDPGIPEDGSRAGASGKFVINSTVSFECFGGYNMSGSKQRNCQSNGQWDGTLTTCSQKTEGCKNPGVPISGHRTGHNFKTGDIVKFTCDPQFTMTGSAERVCQPDGQWNGTETFCRGALVFDRPEDVKIQILVDLDKKMALKDSEGPIRARSSISSINIKNTGGHLVFYFIFDSSKSVGTENFNTSLKFATALVKRVGVSSTVHIGAVTYGKTVVQNIFPLGATTEAKVLEELSKIKEIGGGTSTKPALSHVRDMVATVEINNPKWKPIKSVVYLITDGVHNIGGNPEDVATILKNSGVEIFVIGLVGNDKKVNAGSFMTLASSPKHVLYANGYETMEYLVDVLLNNNTINYTRCGISVRDPKMQQRIFGGKDSTVHWPWMTHLSIKHKDISKICGGSIIDNLWVLTAAHCFPEGVAEDHITVTIGTLNLAEDGAENREKHHVERIYRHPKFNEVSLNFDVAVLKLKRSITFGKYIRRICLPPDLKEIGQGSALFREGENATVTGFGRYDPNSVATSQTLKEVEISLQSKRNCVDSLAKTYPKTYKTLVTDSMMCAGDDEGKKDACEGDSGGPLMQELRNEGGVEPYWVQVGVVSWGVPDKCGVKGYYGYYTNVAKVVPWVYEVMAGKQE